MEKILKIKVSKNNYLYGKFQGNVKQPLFVVVHGIGGDMEEKLIHDSVNFFSENGFATFRFNLYDWRPRARQLVDCDLETFSDDIDRVIKYFRKLGFKKLFLVGHSFGGISIFSSKKQDFDAVALWDPSYKFNFNKKGSKYIKDINGYIMSSGVTLVFNKKLVDVINNLNWNALIKSFRCPTLVVVASKGVLVKKAFNYFKYNINKKSFKIIRNATHLFNDSDRIQKSLFEHTLDWFKKFL